MLRPANPEQAALNAPASLLYPLNLEVKDFRVEDDDYHFHVEPPRPETCEACGTVGELVLFGRADQAYLDLPIHGKRVTLWVLRRRYKCKSCDGTFRPTMPDMDEKRAMTKRLVEYVRKAVLTRTNTDVARETGLDEKTVRQVFQDFAEEEKPRLVVVTPNVLGIDELYMQKQYRCVLTNIREQTVIELLPDRSKETVTAALQGLSHRDNVQIISMDMYRNYLDAARIALPMAMPVVDKFHVVRMANDVVEEIRKSFRKDLKKEDRITLKNERKLLLMRAHELKLRPDLKETVDGWIERFPALGAAYKAKEAFYGLYDAKDLKEARERWDAWKRTIPVDQAPYWNKLAGTIDRWRGPIFNYFAVPERVTNAFTEAANRKMKDLNRATRGMSFDAFRAKVLLGEQHKVIRKTLQRHSPFSGVTVAAEVPRVWVELDFDYGTPLSTMYSILANQDG